MVEPLLLISVKLGRKLMNFNVITQRVIKALLKSYLDNGSPTDIKIHD